MEKLMVITEKNNMKLKLLFFLFLFGLMQLSHAQDKLLWIKKMKHGHEITVSNFLSYKTKTEYIFPLIRIKVDKNDNYISHKGQKLFDYSLFFNEYKPIIFEMYKNNILFITQKEIHETFPLNVKRDLCIIIDINSPYYYYVAKFNKPIYILHKNIDIISDAFSSSYYIDNINLEEKIISLIHHGSQKRIKLSMNKVKNPIFISVNRSD